MPAQLAFGFLATLGELAQELMHAARYIHWRRVPAEVISADVYFTPDGRIETGDGEGRTDGYDVRIVCRTLDGRPREILVEPVAGEGRMFESRGDAQRFVDQLPAGERRHIWVDPWRDDQAAFIRWRDGVWRNIAKLGCMSFILAAIAAVALLIWAAQMIIKGQEPFTSR